MAEGAAPLATVAILTYDGEKYIRRILDAVRSQVVDGRVEILVIDSGSRDGTLAIVGEYSEVRLHTIPNAEFGHGRTRNLAARLATGQFIAFLTHDAIPANERWLAELIAPFATGPSIVAVMGKQIPRQGCQPIIRYDIMRTFAQFGPDFGVTVFQKGDRDLDEGMLGALSFYSDVNSAARRQFLTDVIPYRDVRYGEDQLFGKDVVLAGYAKAYAPAAAVEHSNDLTFAEYGPRIFDETLSLREMGFTVPPLSAIGRLKRTGKGVLTDSRLILRDGSYSWRRKLYWLAVNPAYHVLRGSSYQHAATVDFGDQAAVAAGSLEHQRKSAEA